MAQGKILIVDDMQDIRLLVKRIITKAGFEALEAADGKEAIDIINNENELKLVLLDIMLPDMEGYDVMKAILPKKEANKFKVCFISGKKEKDAVLKAIDSGGDDYIVKPIHPENLLSKIGILLKDIELIESFHHLKTKINAELLYQKIRPDIEIRGIDELSLMIFSTAELKPETKLEIQSEKLNKLLNYDGFFSLKVNKCNKHASGKYFARCRFVGLTEAVATEIRQLAIKGEFIGNS